MASKTTNYNLDMPGYNEIADIDVINGNMDKIDVQMKKNADSAQQSKDIVSDKYSATNTYAVGDYCIHENILYKCKTAITTGEEFDSNKWVQTTCGTEFRWLNSNLDSIGYGDNGAYNLLNPTLQTTTLNGITCTSNGDGIYTLNGSTETFPAFKLGDVYLEKGTYLIDSFSYDGDNPYLWVGKDGENNNIINSFWTKPFTFTLDSKTLVSINMVCTPGQNFSDKLMFPMLIKGTSAQKQYKPYIPSVKMLAEEVKAQNESLGEYDINENATGSYSGSNNFVMEWIKMCKATKGTYKLSYTINGSTGSSSEITLGKGINDKTLYRNVGLISDGIYEQVIDITSDTDVYIMAYTNGSFTISNIKFTLQNVANEVGNIKNDLGGLSFSVSGTTLSITDGTNTWTLEGN